MRSHISSEKLTDLCFGAHENSSGLDETLSPFKQNKGQFSSVSLQKRIPFIFESTFKEESDHSTKHSACYTVYPKESEEFGTDSINIFDSVEVKTKKLSYCNNIIDSMMFPKLEKKNSLENSCLRKASNESFSRRSVSPQKTCKTQKSTEQSQSSNQTTLLEEESPIAKSSSMSLNSLEPEEIDLIEFDIDFTSDDLESKSLCGLDDDTSAEKDNQLGKRCIDDFMTNFNKNHTNDPIKSAEDALAGLGMLENYCKKFVRIAN